MTEMIDKFHQLWQGEFKPDPREQRLIDRIALYHEQTPHEMSNRDALLYSTALHKWVHENGYKVDEFIRAKRDYFNMKRNSPDVSEE